MKISKTKFLITFLSIFTLFKYTYQIFYILDPKESRCISKKLQEKSNFSGNYFVTGETELKNNAIIKNPKGEIIWKDDGHSNGSFNLQVDNEGNCFLLKRNRYLFLMLSIYF